MWNEQGMAMDNGLWHWGMGLHGIVPLIFLGLIVFGFFLLIRDLRREDSNDNAGKTPSVLTGRR